MTLLPPQAGRSEGVLDGGLDAREVALAVVLELTLAPADLRADVEVGERRVDQVGVERLRALGGGETGRPPAHQAAIVVELGHRIHQVAAQLAVEGMPPCDGAAGTILRMQV